MTGELRPPAPPPPNPARVAIWSFVAGVIIWVGGACLFLRGGGSTPPVSLIPTSAPGNPVTISTQPPGTRVPATGTALADRRSCDEIRGTDYRSAAERQFFLQNCQPTPAPAPPTPPPPPTP
jgi:hypothetical protein